VTLKLESFDQPIVFAIAIIMVVVGGIGLMGWLFSSLNLTGPLSLVKGGVVS
jgi:hypothetical protein